MITAIVSGVIAQLIVSLLIGLYLRGRMDQTMLQHEHEIEKLRTSIAENTSRFEDMRVIVALVAEKVGVKNGGSI